MSSQSHESYPTASQIQPTLQEKTINHTEEKISDVVYEVKPAHLNEFDSEPAELQSEIDVLVNDGNPFPPMPNAIEEISQLTVRAIVVGSTLGFTFGASLFGAIFGFAILKPTSHVLPERWGGGYFGPKENCTVQTAATSAGGLTALFIGAVPAMYQLGLLSTPSHDMGRLSLLTAITAFYGLFFAIPLRKYYILKEKLVFPTPTATAFTIRSLHSTASATARLAAKKKVRVLGCTFLISLAFKSLCGYAPGLLQDWHVFYWLYSWGWKGAIAGEAWGWMIELTPAFWGSGMLSGLNASWSFMPGSVLAWGVFGPISIKYGWTVSKPNVYGVDDPNWRNYMSMTSAGGDFVHHASPRYWAIWPGIMVMLCYSFAELSANAPIFWRSMRQVGRSIRYDYLRWQGRRKGVHVEDTRPDSDRALIDPAAPSEQVPFWMWCGGIILSIVGTVVVGKLSFQMNVSISIVSLLLAFMFSFIGVQSSGTTDVNPVGTISKASQLVIGGVTKAEGLGIQKAHIGNLIGGSIAGQAASHGVDMTGDLKTGHLLRASPKAQFISQVLGSVIGIWLSVGIFILFATAYPCITDTSIECTAFGLPAVFAWRAISVAVTFPTLPIPPSSGLLSIIFGILAVITVLVKHTLIPRRWHPWVPNWNVIGLGFVVPQTYYPIAMVIGAHVAYTWGRRWPKSWEVWGFALSAGLIAGEGMGGVVTAMFTIVKIDGSLYGSAVACPAGQFCG